MISKKAATGLSVLLVTLAACQTVPFTGRHHLILVSAREEKGMGLKAYEETLAKARLSSDQEKVALIRRVGERLAQVADKPDFKWEFNLIEEDKTINAWCLPGGKVAVYTGLLPVARDEDGLAVVMGHEIAHALARHGSERMSQGVLAKVGGAALSVALGGSSPLAQRAFAEAYGVGVNVGVLLPFSRGQESEADHIGLILMAKAGYDPQHALSFWGRMREAADKGDESSLGRFLRTHPPDLERQRQIQKWLPEAYTNYHPVQ